MASGKLIYALTDGRLWRVDWAGTNPNGAVTQIDSATTWASRSVRVQPGRRTCSRRRRLARRPERAPPSTRSICPGRLRRTTLLVADLPRIPRRPGDRSGEWLSTGTITYTDTGLVAGSTHRYTVDALDGSNNPSPLSDLSENITVLAPDTTPPTQPGKPTGVTAPRPRSRCRGPRLPTRHPDLPIGSTGMAGRASSPVAELVDRDLSFTDTGLCPGVPTPTPSTPSTDRNKSNKVTSAPISVLTASSRTISRPGPVNWTSVTRISLDVAKVRLRRRVLGDRRRHSPRSPTWICPPRSRRLRERQCERSTGPPRWTSSAFAGGERGRSRGVRGRSGPLFVRSDFAGSQVSSGVAFGTGWHRSNSAERPVRGHLGSVPGRDEDRERVDSQHRRESDRPPPDRRQRGEDVVGQLRRSDPGHRRRLA